MTELRPDTLAVNYEEAKGFLERANLQHKVLVLEDQYDGEIVSRALLGGGPDEYHLVGKNLETDPPQEWESTLSLTMAAEMVAGWSVVERRRIERSVKR